MQQMDRIKRDNLSKILPSMMVSMMDGQNLTDFGQICPKSVQNLSIHHRHHLDRCEKEKKICPSLGQIFFSLDTIDTGLSVHLSFSM